MRPRKKSWTIDKQIPVTLLLALLLQAVSAVVWAAQLEARINTVEQITNDGSGLNEKFARLEERLDFLKQDIEALSSSSIALLIKRSVANNSGYIVLCRFRSRALP